MYPLLKITYSFSQLYYSKTTNSTLLTIYNRPVCLGHLILISTLLGDNSYQLVCALTSCRNRLSIVLFMMISHMPTRTIIQYVIDHI